MIHNVIRQTSQFMLQRSQPSYQRFLLTKIDFHDRLIGIKSLRESFFVSQLSHQHQVHYHHQADFIIDEHTLFEIGGAGKTKKQIKSLDASYLALDNIEVGHHHTIPLWMFGLLY
jgi:hypothetical protein